MARLEEALADVLGHKMPAAEQPGSQYQSAEQLTDNDHHQSISRQISAIMEQQRSLLEEKEEEVEQRADPFNIPDEEEFFNARQTFKTTPNQS